MINLTPRLLKTAELITPCKKLADIGTDHAYIPVYALQNNLAETVVASDINEALSDGESVHLGEFGSFRMVAGSKGSATVDGFTTALFNRAHIVFYPGTMLINLVNNVSFERYVPKKDASSESAGSGGGTDDRPGEL